MKSNRHITNAGIRKLYHLESLNLSYNSSITEIQTLTNLTDLNLSHIGAHEAHVPDKFLRHLEKIKTLSLEANPVIRLDAIQHLSSTLTSLNLNDNKRIKDITIFSNLVSLEISQNTSICTFHPNHFTSLTHLNLSSNNTIGKREPNLINDFVNLKSLILMQNNMINNFTRLTNLTFLNLSNNLLVSDSTLSCLTNLNFLNITYANSISDKSVSLLTNLTTLITPHRNPNITKDCFIHLTKLSTLSVDGHTIDIPFLTQLNQLTNLSLTNLNLGTFIFIPFFELCQHFPKLELFNNNKLPSRKK